MNGKTKFVMIGLPVALALGSFLSDFWSCTICALGKAGVSGMVVLLVLSKFLGGIAGIHFLL